MERQYAIRGTASPSPDPARFDYIDSLRGLAIAGVITTHSLILFPDLPWLVRQLGGLGSHGVHLFFVASALTLMVSWSSRRDGALSFYTRRAFRIVPMFYLATMLYLLLGSVLERPFWADGAIDFRAVLLTLLMINGWVPDAINSVVPGGWTISVEMTFYVIFPLLAVLITTPLRAAIFVALALVIAAAANMSIPILYPGIDTSALKFFSYYWLPNSLPSFAIGVLAFSLLSRAPRGRWAASCLLLCAGLAAAFVMLGPLPYSSSFAQPIARGTMIAAAGMLLVLSFHRVPNGLFVNRIMSALGRVSYSAYLIHWLVVEALLRTVGAVHAGPRLSCLIWPCAVLMIVATTGMLASASYRYIERPAIRAGSRFARQLPRRRIVAPSV